MTKKIVTATLVLLLTSQAAVATTDLDNCNARVSECDAVIDLAEQVIDQQSTTIDELSDQNARLQRELERTTEDLDQEQSWIRDPKTVGVTAFVLGVMAGLFATKK